MTDGYRLPDEIIEQMFMAFEGKSIDFPERFTPVAEYVEFHRNRVFLSA